MKQTAISERAKEEISSIKVGSDCKIAMISPDDIDVVWDRISEYIQHVVDHSRGEATLEDYYENISTGDMQLWVAVSKNEVLALSLIHI